MNQDLAWQIRKYVRDHCGNEFPKDRARQTNLLHMAGYSRLRVGAGKANSGEWGKCSLPIASCKDERVRAVAHQQYDLAQRLFDEMEDKVDEWPAQDVVSEGYRGSGCECIDYLTQ